MGHRELATVATRLAAETGMTYRPVQEGQRASGTYRQAVAVRRGRVRRCSSPTLSMAVAPHEGSRS
jgi:Protein of unknown function (DUF3363)